MEINKVYNMDCMFGMKDIKDKNVDLVLTDPPYWHKKSPGKPYSDRKQCKTDSSFSNSKLFNAEGFMMGEMSDFGEEQINAVLKEFVRVCKIPNMYIFCNETQVPYYAMWAEKKQPNVQHISLGKTTIHYKQKPFLTECRVYCSNIRLWYSFK